MTHYVDDPSKYIPDTILAIQAEQRAEEARQADRQAQAELTAAKARQEQAEREHAEAVERSLAGNQQLLAQQYGMNSRIQISGGKTTQIENRYYSSRDLEMVAPKAVIETTPIFLGGVQVGPQQAIELIEQGIFSKAEYDAGLTEALAAKGYKRPFEEAPACSTGDQAKTDIREIDRLPDDELTDDELKERREKEHAARIAEVDQHLDEWRSTTPEEQQQSTADAFIETGEIDHELAGVPAEVMAKVEAGFIAQTEKMALSEFGLSHEQWMEHVADEDLPTFRRAALKGDWKVFRDHAQQCATMRMEMGLNT
ncbi:hypothetical protein RZ532_08505 [Nitratireductor aquimarinus]|uniref:hypothetical protein n=1 Tax=Nitratireductor aquimarinus TaxID=889300 RepID=UPI0029362D4B|nr:hypothetical protein [Nitratireductor aquimarinus]MDV2966012.1 hypothetical protein [Nitratireductor aquimarinus]